MRTVPLDGILAKLRPERKAGQSATKAQWQGPLHEIGFHRHWQDAPWDHRRWPSFKAHEFACRHCGELYYDSRMFDRIQMVCTRLGRPLRINSAHRCSVHNRAVGGAAHSRHLRLALDVDVSDMDESGRRRLFGLAREAGFDAFGFYGTFLHVDDRKGRRWWTNKGKETWSFLAH